MMARSSAGSDSNPLPLDTRPPWHSCSFDAAGASALHAFGPLTRMEENTVAAAETIRFGHVSVGVSHPADAIHHKEIAIAPRRQQKTERPHAITVGASQRVRLRSPSVEAAHDADPPGGRGLEPEHDREGTLRISPGQGGTTHEEADRQEDAGHEAPGASHGAEPWTSTLRPARLGRPCHGRLTDRDPGFVSRTSRRQNRAVSPAEMPQSGEPFDNPLVTVPVSLSPFVILNSAPTRSSRGSSSPCAM